MKLGDSSSTVGSIVDVNDEREKFLDIAKEAAVETRGLAPLPISFTVML